VYGIDISGKGNLAIGGIVFDPIWRASVSIKSVFLPIVLMMITSIVASIYPASIAARIKPVEAINYKP
jgi:ABC-type lipoprotein release transport system permease subunit